MPRLVFPLLLLLAGWMVANSARAQGGPAPAPTTAEAPRDDQVRVFLVTVGPGKEVWERFGHNMIWIHDPQQRPGGPDAAYNWGIFDFSNFIPFANPAAIAAA
jgi:hypothetical protein